MPALFLPALFPLLLPAQQPEIPPLKSSITVVEKVTAEAPAAITVLSEEQVRENPGVSLDDRLRMVPGFSLFRRSSGLVAHPTTQGVSLRGIGSSGASRTLVMWDGIPANDPFGGWVYWNRFFPEQLERVEISRGASTSVFGDLALGGVVGLFSRPASAHHLTAGYEGGNRNSHEVSAGYSHLWGRFGASARARAFTTDGYFIVPEHRRGSADAPAGVRFVGGETRLDYLGSPNRMFLRFDVLAEERKNGTVLQNNSTGLGTAAGHYARELPSGELSLVGYHTRAQFHSSFSSITNNRNTERITFLQRVPSEAAGGAGFWRRQGSSWNLLAGGDVRRTSGESIESLPDGTRRIGGGDLAQGGFFAQSDFSVGRTKVFLGGRQQFASRDQKFFSPSAGFATSLGMARFRGSVYRSFRAPTLNELFREFRVGNAVTQANPNLRPEKLFGAEAGVDVLGESRRASITVFRNSLEDLVTNVTLQSSPTLEIRQRRNAAAAVSRGMEVNVEQRLGSWRGELGYLFADSRFDYGGRVPQIPKHQGSAQVTYHRGGTLASAGIRSYSRQFEAEGNPLMLPGFASVQMMFRQRLTGSLSATAAFENLLDREYVVGLVPSPIIGPPRLWRIGLRWDGKVR